MPVSKPDATKFDNANDSIAESRAELYTLATSFNTIADEYNAGTLGGNGTDYPNTSVTNVSVSGTTNTTLIAGVLNSLICTGSGSGPLNVECNTLGYNVQTFLYIDVSGITAGPLNINLQYNGTTFHSNNAGTSTPYLVRILDTGLEGSSAGSNNIAVFGGQLGGFTSIDE